MLHIYVTYMFIYTYLYVYISTDNWYWTTNHGFILGKDKVSLSWKLEVVLLITLHLGVESSVIFPIHVWGCWNSLFIYCVRLLYLFFKNQYIHHLVICKACVCVRE